MIMITHTRMNTAHQMIFSSSPSMITEELVAGAGNAPAVSGL